MMREDDQVRDNGKGSYRSWSGVLSRDHDGVRALVTPHFA